MLVKVMNYCGFKNCTCFRDIIRPKPFCILSYKSSEMSQVYCLRGIVSITDSEADIFHVMYYASFPLASFIGQGKTTSECYSPLAHIS